MKKEVLNKWFEVFRAGNHTDAKGKERNFSEEDVNKIAEIYNNQNSHLAPLVKGHPKDNEPAFGWVGKLKAEAGRLYLQFSELSKEIIEDVRDGKYKFTSISLYPNMLLRHVGILGAVPPAVKGLAPVQFTQSEEDVMSFDFSEMYELQYIVQSLGTMIQGLRDDKIAKDGVDEADKFYSQWLIDACKQFTAPEEKTAIQQNALQTNFNEEYKMTNEELTQQNEQLKNDLKTANDKIAEMKESQSAAEEFNFCETLIKEGKLTPSEKDETLRMLKSLRELQAVEFSDTEGNKKTETPYETYKNQLQKRTPMIEFKEAKGKSVGPQIHPDVEEGELIAQAGGKKN